MGSVMKLRIVFEKNILCHVYLFYHPGVTVFILHLF